ARRRRHAAAGGGADRQAGRHDALRPLAAGGGAGGSAAAGRAGHGVARGARARGGYSAGRNGQGDAMSGVPMEHGLVLAAILFSLGLAGLMFRRNMIFLLMSLEIMLNAAGLAFIVAGT